jgi:DNA-directed RNA polymerase specialized sigma24 family protein
MLTRYVRAVVATADAEDVTQDAMMSIYRKLWRLTDPDLFRPWMANREPFGPQLPQETPPLA